EPLKEREGYAELVRRWLATFGPGTEADIVWWLGSTKSAVRAALADVAAVEVALEGGQVGWVLPGDLEIEPDLEPWAALLPVLDPTVMGWKERDFYLGALGPQLFDTNGNAGTTAWWDGRIVGCWVQDPDGVVVLNLLEDVGSDARAALAAEADRLTTWLAGHRVSTVYPSIAMKTALAP
ncbi:DNA glycosylase AlkZ-like family protein, partial [Nocardioides hankookensis]